MQWETNQDSSTNDTKSVRRKMIERRIEQLRADGHVDEARALEWANSNEGRIEARTRYEVALRHVLNASAELDHACSELGSLMGAAKLQDATKKIADVVTGHVRELAGDAARDDVILDTDTAAAVFKARAR